MALRFRIVAVPSNRAQEGVDANGQPLPPIVAWQSGLVFVDVQVYDDAGAQAGQTILNRSYDFPSGRTNNEMLQAINADLWRMKQAADRIAGLQGAVNQHWQIKDPADPTAPGNQG